MYEVSTKFKQMAMQNVKTNLVSYVSYNDNGKEVRLDQSNDLMSIKIQRQSDLASSSMTMAVVSYKGNHQLLGKEISIGYGFLIDGVPEYIEHKSMLVNEITSKQGSETTEVVCYDYMVNLMVEVQQFDINFPCKINDIIKSINLKFGITSTLPNKNGDMDVLIEAYTNTGYTYRDVIDDIAEATNSVVFFKDKHMIFAYEKPKVINLTEKQLSKYDFSKQFGGVNSVVLSRQPQEDNIYAKDQSSVDINGLHEIKLSDNLLFDDSRERVVDGLLTIYKDFKLYPFNAETIGILYLEPFDKIEFNVKGAHGETFVLGYELDVTSGLKETIYCNEVIKSSTNYKYASDSKKQARRTHIKVDKQQGEIEMLVESNGKIDKQISQIKQDMESISLNVSEAQSNNIIYNFNGEKMSDGWEFSQNGLLPSTTLLPSTSLLPQGTNTPIFRTRQSPRSLSETERYFFSPGYATSKLTKIVEGGEKYSFMARRMIGYGKFKVKILEYSSETTLTKTTTILDTQTIRTYEFGSITLQENTKYIKFQYETKDSGFSLSEAMFNRGEPRKYFKSGQEAFDYAESEIKILSDEINLKVNVDEYESQINLLKGEIGLKVNTTDYESKITLMDNNIESKVSKDKVVSTINQSSEAVTIDANKINLNGATTINNKVVIDTEGKLHAEDGEFSGTIKSSNIIGGTINVDTDVSVGNSIMLGKYDDRKVMKKILFNDKFGVQSRNDIMTIGLHNDSLFDHGSIAFWAGGSILQKANNFLRLECQNPTTGNHQSLMLSDISITSTVPITVSSDKRFKENIEDIDLTDAIDLINIKSFNYIGNEKETIGIIAQDLLDTSIEKIIVSKHNDRYAVDYNAIAMIGIYETKKLKQKIEEQAEDIEKLSNEVSELKELVQALLNKESDTNGISKEDI